MTGRRLVGAVAALAVVLAGCTSSVPHVELRVVLDKTTAPANGQPISGYVEITNDTGYPVTITDPCNGWIGVGLTNGKVTYHLIDGLVTCPAGRLPVGTSRHRILVATTYDRCAQHGGSTLPRCIGANRDVMPRLPPGTYTTSALAQGLPARIPLPPPITVTLFMPAH
ncbi:MAG: hypothetical protein QOI25_999 [Mycobacterium sp.]|jgi:hypothetical protein|nr:hypothetical protein [Mycobacterium sp.]